MRKMKVLGLALVAMFAMSAVAATAASADAFTAEKYPVTLTGKRHTATLDKFITTSGTVNCEEVSYHGTVQQATTSVTMTPAYSKCTAFGFPATIHMNGCDYKFTIEGGTSTKGSAHIECTGANEITVTAISAGTTKCTVHVPAQTIGGVTYNNFSSGATGEITVTVKVVSGVNSLKYTHTAGTGLGACTGGSANNGSFEGAGIVTGEEEASPFNHIGLSLSND